MDKEIIVGAVDALATTIVLLIGRFVSPGDAELCRVLVLAWKPLTVAVIVAIAYKEGLLIKERTAIAEAREYARDNAEFRASLNEKKEG